MNNNFPEWVSIAKPRFADFSRNYFRLYPSGEIVEVKITGFVQKWDGTESSQHYIVAGVNRPQSEWGPVTIHESELFASTDEAKEAEIQMLMKKIEGLKDPSN